MFASRAASPARKIALGGGGLGLSLGLLLGSTAADAAPTQAGTIISNTARATYSLPGGGSGSVDSNTVNLMVDELLDVTVTRGGGDVGVVPGATGQAIAFTLTNTGNGNEAFRLTARNTTGADDFDPSAFAIYLDSNGNGQYDPGIDAAYSSGGNDPVLASDGSTTIFIVSTIGAGSTDTQRAGLDLLAVAATGSGTPGTSFAGAGASGGNAIVGATGGDADATGFYRVSAATVAFAKSASVLDPFGGTSAVPGSIITYSLVATVSGSGSLSNLAISDAIPTGSTYVPGSLTLGGSALTDATDADSGEHGGSGIAVRLGTVPAGQTRTVTFKVEVSN